MEENELISIIIPVYNQEKFLETTLQSVLSQTYSNWECFLVNDGSQDGSIKIIEKYCTIDPRFQMIQSENRGVSHARNLGMQNLNGKYLLFLDADDLIHTQKIEKAMSVFHENKELSIVFNTTNYFQERIENTLYAIRINVDLLNFNDLLLYWNEKLIIPIHSAIFKKELFHTIDFNTDLTAQEDWLVWLRLFQQNPKVFVIGEVLSYYRKHKSSRTQSASLKEDHFKALQIFEKYIDAENYKRLLLHQIKRYYIRAYENGYKLNAIKISKSYRIAMFVKRILVKFKLLGIITFLSAKFFKNGK